METVRADCVLPSFSHSSSQDAEALALVLIDGVGHRVSQRDQLGRGGQVLRALLHESADETELDLVREQEKQVQAKLDAHMKQLQLQLQASDVLEELHNAREWVKPSKFGGLRRSHTFHSVKIGAGADPLPTGEPPAEAPSTGATLARARTSAEGLTLEPLEQ